MASKLDLFFLVKRTLPTETFVLKYPVNVNSIAQGMYTAVADTAEMGPIVDAIAAFGSEIRTEAIFSFLFDCRKT